MTPSTVHLTNLLPPEPDNTQMQNKSKDKVASIDITSETGNHGRSVLYHLAKFWRTRFGLDVETIYTNTSCSNIEILLYSPTDHGGPPSPDLSWSGKRKVNAWLWCLQDPAPAPLPTCCLLWWIVPISKIVTTILRASSLSMSLADSQQIMQGTATSRWHLPFHMVVRTIIVL